MAYSHARPRNLSMNRIPTLLPDIAELSPGPEPTRTPSPTRRSLRSVSVASFMSDGTVEIDGFGFDTISESGDDALSLYGGESVYEDSVFGDSQDPEHPQQQRESQDLSRRAERILANAKRKLDLCGQNISRARNSMVMSPTLSPIIPMGDHAGLPDIASIASIASVMEMDDVLGKFPVPRSRAGSTTAAEAGAQRWRWQKPEQTTTAPGSGGGAPVQNREHIRTASESAVPRSGGLDTAAMTRKLNNVPEEQEQGVGSRSKSAQQMRSLRDQMKDLRGKISSLQEQAQKDSVRRRQSVSSMRSTSSATSATSTSTGFYSNPSLEEIRESRVLDIKDGDDWEDMLPPKRESARTHTTSRSSSRSSGTPKPHHLRDDAANSPFSERHEDRFDAFSYDSLLIGNSFVSAAAHRRTLSSSSSTSTATILQPPHLERADSQQSISSYATATESIGTSTPQRLHHQHSLSPSTSGSNLRHNPSPSTTISSSGVSSPSTAIMSGLRPPPTSSVNPAADDGYHSAPHTPHPHPTSRSPAGSAPPIEEHSWYRDSLATDAESENSYNEPKHQPYTNQHHRNQPSYSSSTYSQVTTSSTSSYPKFNHLNGTSSRHSSRHSSRNHSRNGSRNGSGTSTPTTTIPAAAALISRHATPVTIGSSIRDSQTMILGGVVEGKDEVELKVGRQDRLLIEGVIETLGRVCCELEIRGGTRREELRERLRGAMRVLEGWEGELEMF